VMLVSTRAPLGLLLPAIPVHQVVPRQPLDRSPHRPAFVLPAAVAPTAVRALCAMLVSTRALSDLLLPATPVHQVVPRQPLDRSLQRPASALLAAVAPTALRAPCVMLVSTRAPLGLLLPAIPVHQVVPRQPLDRSPQRPASALLAAVAPSALRALSAMLVSTRAALGFLPRTSSFICFIENMFFFYFYRL